jgi:hypothetical protein
VASSALELHSWNLAATPPEMLISKILGSQGTQHNELLSYVLFDSMFASEAIDLGREHAY